MKVREKFLDFQQKRGRDISTGELIAKTRGCFAFRRVGSRMKSRGSQNLRENASWEGEVN